MKDAIIVLTQRVIPTIGGIWPGTRGDDSFHAKPDSSYRRNDRLLMGISFAFCNRIEKKRMIYSLFRNDFDAFT